MNAKRIRNGRRLTALLLCLQNPYAAVDVSLLLSFSATLGVLWVMAAHRRWRAGRRMLLPVPTLQMQMLRLPMITIPGP